MINQQILVTRALVLRQSFRISTRNLQRAHLSSSRRRLWLSSSLSRPPPSTPTAGRFSNTASLSTSASSSNDSNKSIAYTSTDEHNNHVINPEFLSELRSTSPHIQINTNKYDLMVHGRGESYHQVAPPAAILEPRSTCDVSTILKLCNKYDVPVVPFGCGTSVEGHVSALIPGSVSLDMKGFKSIGGRYEIDDDDNSNGDGKTNYDDQYEYENEDGDSLDQCITVGAGVTRLELNDYLRHSGMQFMVDPGADASIGGMVACGASGTTAVKYGTMRENILSLQCVLPDGTVAKCGTRALKSSAGYDLVSLMTGSEGTLGVITHVTVKLHPIPDCTVAAVCTFDTLYDAAGAVSDMRMCAVDVQRCELLDGRSVEAFVKYTAANNNSNNNNGSNSGKNMKIKPTLFLEFTGPNQTAVTEQVKITESICISSNGSNFQFTADETERKSLWAARHQLYYASIALRSGADSAIVTDACVPLSAFAKVLTETVRDVEEQGVVGPCFGHAGDGNFHCILPIIGCRDSGSRSDSHDSEEYLQKLHLVNDNLIRRTINAGGTCTGEHGVGYGKIKYLEEQYGKGGVEMMRMIKRALDPKNIMNPNKVVIIKELA